MRTALSILLLLSANALAAVGDITGAAVETNGWVLDLYVSGLNTNGNVFPGLTTNWSLTSTTALTLNLTSMGFGDTGDGLQVAQTNYGTKVLRLPYPNQAINNIIPNGNGCIVRLALHDCVIQSDSNITLTATAGAYAVTNGSGTNCNAVSSLTVTNNSTNAYQKVVFDWSMPPFRKMTNNTCYLFATAFHGSARNYKPVRAVRFIVTSTNSISVTNVQTAPQIVSGMNDTNPICEYYAAIDVSTLPNGTTLKCDVEAYPWVGDTNAAWISARDGNAQTNWLCNDLPIVAVVSVTNWSATPVVTTNFNGATPAAFSNITAAVNACAASNNIWFGRNHAGGCTIYLREGSYDPIGPASTYGSVTEPSWIKVAAFPGASRASVVLTNLTTAAQILSSKLAYSGITIIDSRAITWSSQPYLWMDNVYITGSGSAPFYGTTRCYWTYSTVNTLSEGFQNFGATDVQHLLFRSGVWTNNGSQSFFCKTVLGSKLWDVAATAVNERVAQPTYDPFIFAFNKGYQNLDTSFYFAQGSNLSVGGAIVQNLIERTYAGGGAALWVAADGTSNNVNNVLLWNNTVVGGRINSAYNSIGSWISQKLFWSKLNNASDDDNIKADLFVTEDSARVGNWSQVWGVGSYANALGNVAGIGAVGFTHTGEGGMPGMNTWETSESGQAPTNYYQYKTNLAYNGTSAGAGMGDYHVNANSPLFGIATLPVLPYDLGGTNRSAGDAPGAFANGTAQSSLPPVPYSGTFPPVHNPRVVYLFSDNFETEDAYHWGLLTNNVAGFDFTSPSCFVGATNSQYHSGNYSLQCTFPNVSGYRLWEVKHTLNDSHMKEINMRTYIYFDPGFVIPDGQAFSPVSLGGPTWGAVGKVLVKRSGANYVMGTENLGYGTDHTFALGQWLCVEEYYKTTNSTTSDGAQSLWCNGVLQVGQTNIEVKYDIGDIRIGYKDYTADGIYGTYWIDDFVISTNAIGQSSTCVDVCYPEMNGRLGAPLFVILSGKTAGDALKVDLLTAGSFTSTVTNFADLSATNRYRVLFNMAGFASNAYSLRFRLTNSGLGSTRFETNISWVKNFAGDPLMAADEYNNIKWHGTNFFPIYFYEIPVRGINSPDEVSSYLASNWVNFTIGNMQTVQGSVPEFKWMLENVPCGMAGPIHLDESRGPTVYTPGSTATNFLYLVTDSGATNYPAPYPNWMWSISNYFFQFKAETNLAAWWFIDESDLNGYDYTNSRTWFEYKGSNDPSRMIWGDLEGQDFYTRTEERMFKAAQWSYPHQAFDMIGGAWYPVTYTNNTLWSDGPLMMRNMRKWNFDLIPTYQAVSPSDIRDASVGASGLMPTPDQVSAQAWISVVCGGKSMYWFDFNFTDPPNPTPQANYDRIQQFKLDMDKWKEIVMAPEFEVATSTNGIVASGRTYQGTNWIMAQNIYSNSITATVNGKSKTLAGYAHDIYDANAGGPALGTLNVSGAVNAGSVH